MSECVTQQSGSKLMGTHYDCEDIILCIAQILTHTNSNLHKELGRECVDEQIWIEKRIAHVAVYRSRRIYDH